MMSKTAIRVVWPLGNSHWDKRDLNPGLADLNGKTVAEVWDACSAGRDFSGAAGSAEEKNIRACASSSTTRSGIRTASIRNRCCRYAGAPAPARVDAVILE